jgi:membrane protease YdiL (CAAX protease family)
MTDDGSARAPRRRAIAALTIFVSVLVAFGVRRGLPEILRHPVDRRLEQTGLDFLARLEWSILIVELATLGLVLLLGVLLVFLFRGRSGVHATVRTWFPPGGARGFLLGVVLSSPLLVVPLVRGGAAALGSPTLWSVFAVSVSAGPFVEEVLFRGVVFPCLVQDVRLHPWAALAIASFVFGAWHVHSFADLASIEGWERLLMTGAFGAVVCRATWLRGGDLCLPLGVHCAGNAWILLSHRPRSMNADTWALISGYSQVATIGLAYLFLMWQKDRRRSSASATPVTATESGSAEPGSSPPC